MCGIVCAFNIKSDSIGVRSNVLKMDDAEKEMINTINIKMIKGPSNS